MKGEVAMKKRLTLKDIEKHLQQQDRQMARAPYVSVILFGFSIVLVGLSLVVAKVTDIELFWLYIFLTFCGFGLVNWARIRILKLGGRDPIQSFFGRRLSRIVTAFRD